MQYVQVSLFVASSIILESDLKRVSNSSLATGLTSVIILRRLYGEKLINHSPRLQKMALYNTNLYSTSQCRKPGTHEYTMTYTSIGL